MSFYDALGWLGVCVCATSVPITDFTFFYLYITEATGLDLRNPQRKAARYVAWKAAIRRKSAGYTHTHIHTHTHT